MTPCLQEPVQFSSAHSSSQKIPYYLFLGNHEPFLYLLPYENEGPKELVKNLWVLRRSGVIELCGIKIAYLSRVFSPKTYFKGAVWNPEKDRRTKKSELAGHFTVEDVKNLILESQKAGKIDILALHENPLFCGNVNCNLFLDKFDM